jgi:hypothetical protein
VDEGVERKEEAAETPAPPVRLLAADGLFGRLTALGAALPELLARGLIRCRCPFCAALSGAWDDDEATGLPVWPSKRFRSWLGRFGIDVAGEVRDLVLTGGLGIDCEACGKKWWGGVS